MDWPQDAAHTPVASAKALPRDWRSDSRFVYIGLPGYGDGLPKTGTYSEQAYFGKPWDIIRGLPKHDPEGQWRAYYWKHLIERMNDPVFVGALAQLHGKTLVCWCKHKRPDQWCHGDALAYAAEKVYHGLTG